VYDPHYAEDPNYKGLAIHEVAQFRKESRRYRLIDEANRYLLHDQTGLDGEDFAYSLSDLKSTSSLF